MSPPAGTTPAAGSGFRVFSQTGSSEVGVQTLVGDYVEKGSNHGKKFYQKMQKIAGFEDVSVYLYYWDQRDGAEFSGWWFGDQVGGSQVWARVPNHGMTPPRVGWKIPWDSQVAKPGQLLVEPTGAQAGPASGKAAPQQAAPSAIAQNQAQKMASAKDLAEKLVIIQKQVEEQAKNCQEAVTAVSELLGSGPATSEQLTEMNEQLECQSAPLNELITTLNSDIARGRQIGPSAFSTVSALAKLTPKVRSCQGSLVTQANRVKTLLKQAQVRDAEEKRLQEQEEKDAEDFSAIRPEMESCVGAAEDGTEAVKIQATPLVEDPPEGEAAKAAMDEVEQSAQDAQKRIGDARVALNAKLQSAKKYAPKTRKDALAAFAALQTRLTEAQKKLNPYKRFRQDFSQRVAAKKAANELNEKLNDVELEVEKASLMTRPHDVGQMPEDEVVAAEEAAKAANAVVTNAVRLVEHRLKGVTEAASRDEFMAMRERAQESKTKLDAVLANLRRQREGLAAKLIIDASTEKVDKVAEAMTKCDEAELPFLKGMETMPEEEAKKACAACDAAAQQAQATISQASAFIK